MTFTLAIIGRPNVGKSTLFNRLVGKRLALVDDTPGVTRDRREGEAHLHDLSFSVFDTAGIEESPSESMTGRMRAQTEAAMQAADVLALVIDARAGLLPADRALADMARRTGKPVLVLANKAEGRAGGAGATEAFALGLGEPIAISAEHGDGMTDLRDGLAAIVGAGGDEGDEDEAARDARTRPIRVAIVGRPNAGKSTLVNCILGEERLLTGPEAGLTRDSITVPLDWGGRAFQLVDTAGLRRRSRVEEKLEKLSVAETLRAIRLAEVVVVVMDVRTPFEEQDLRIVDLVEQEGRALVLAMTKWDVAERKTGAISRLRTDADHWLPQVKGVPLVAVSGLTGEGIDRLRLAVIDAFTVWNRRLPTSGLNRWFSAMLQAHAPPAVSGRSIKLNYVTQAKSRPPTFVIFCSRADAVPDSYRRYLVNGLRETFELPGTPIRLVLREKANPFAGRRKRR